MPSTIRDRDGNIVQVLRRTESEALGGGGGSLSVDLTDALEGADPPLDAGNVVAGVNSSVPIADSTDVVIDTTTYDNTWTNDGKLRTAVFPQVTVVQAIAVDGDDFPRVVMTDPMNGWYFGDGTVNPVNAGAAWWIGGPDVNGAFSQTIEGGAGSTQRAIFGHLDANAGYTTQFQGGGIQFQRYPTPSAALSFSGGLGAPAVGGNVGDLYFRADPSGANQTIYRCTVAGTAGNATWAGIL